MQQINHSKKNLQQQADKKFESGDYFGAIRLTYFKIDRFQQAEMKDYFRLAMCYEELGVYSQALKNLYRFLNICDEGAFYIAYDQIARCYYFLENDEKSLYYRRKSIETDDEMSQDDKEHLFALFEEEPHEKSNEFHFVYPPKLADNHEELVSANEALRSGDFASTLKILSGIKKGSKAYGMAQEMTAVTLLLQGDIEGAEETCLAVLKDNPDSVRTLTTLAAIYSEEDRRAESKRLVEKLCSMEGTTAEEKYKIATIACDNGMHEKALEIFSEIAKDSPYDKNLLYFKAVAAAESGDDATAESTLTRLVDLYPHAEVAKYYLQSLRLHRLHPKTNKRPEFTYFYRVPDKVRQKRLVNLNVLTNLQGTDGKDYGENLITSGVLSWAFDEMNGTEIDLQFMAVEGAMYVADCGSYIAQEFLMGVMLNPEISDIVKIDALRLVLEDGCEHHVGIVVEDIYKEINVREVNLGKKKRTVFLRGYAEIASKFALFGVQYLGRIVRTTENLYADLQAADSLELVKTPEALAAAIYESAELTEMGEGLKRVCALFRGSAREAKRILDAAKELKEKRTITYDENGNLVSGGDVEKWLLEMVKKAKEDNKDDKDNKDEE